MYRPCPPWRVPFHKTLWQRWERTAYTSCFTPLGNKEMAARNADRRGIKLTTPPSFLTLTSPAMKPNLTNGSGRVFGLSSPHGSPAGACRAGGSTCEQDARCASRCAPVRYPVSLGRFKRPSTGPRLRWRTWSWLECGVSACVSICPGPLFGESRSPRDRARTCASWARRLASLRASDSGQAEMGRTTTLTVRSIAVMRRELH